jgi:hypothetical protein
MPSKESKTIARSLRLDVNADRILGQMAVAGLLGGSKAEVAAAILWQWFWSNQEKLESSGIKLVGRQAKQ